MAAHDLTRRSSIHGNDLEVNDHQLVFTWKRLWGDQRIHLPLRSIDTVSFARHVPPWALYTVLGLVTVGLGIIAFAFAFKEPLGSKGLMTITLIGVICLLSAALAWMLSQETALVIRTVGGQELPAMRTSGHNAGSLEVARDAIVAALGPSA